MDHINIIMINKQLFIIEINYKTFDLQRMFSIYYVFGRRITVYSIHVWTSKT